MESLLPNPGINCGIECSASFEGGKEVELEATSTAGSEFTGWTTLAGTPGTCTGTTSPCKVTMSEAIELKATFDLEPVLTIAKTGLGSGKVECKFNGGGLTPCVGSGPTPKAYGRSHCHRRRGRCLQQVEHRERIGYALPQREHDLQLHAQREHLADG